jgi:methyl-accepting chemotaxis protein
MTRRPLLWKGAGAVIMAVLAFAPSHGVRRPAFILAGLSIMVTMQAAVPRAILTERVKTPGWVTFMLWPGAGLVAYGGGGVTSPYVYAYFVAAYGTYNWINVRRSLIGRRVQFTPLQAPIYVAAGVVTMLVVAGLDHQLDAAYQQRVLVLAVSVVFITCGMMAEAATTTGFVAVRLSELARMSRHAGVISQAFGRLAKGDVSESARLDLEGDLGDFADVYHELADNFNQTASRLRSLVQGIQHSTGDVVVAGTQVRSVAQLSASSAHQQASAVTTSSATIEELAHVASQIADTAGSVARVAQETMSEVQGGERAVLDTVSTINDISERVEAIASRTSRFGEMAERIGSILSIIDDIAEQTNLLALNAAIEAARAGEAGRGFSVVAEEVRKLAERTQSATRDIQGIVGQITSSTHSTMAATDEGSREVREGAARINAAADVLRGITEMAAGAAAAAKQISAGTDAQRLASSQIADSMTEVSQLTTEQDADAAELSRGAEALAGIAAGLDAATEALKV